ncbi:MAG: branched-chain amino acid ABC transporter permease [Micromonosporaceae bacterium]
MGDQVSRWWARAPWWQRWAVYALAIVGALLLPNATFMTPAAHWPTVLFYPIGGFVLLAIGLNVVVGQAGLLDLGYVAFFAIGGYTMAVLGTKFGLGFWEIMPLAIVISAAAGVILGAPTLRLRGDYLAIVTLGFGEIVRVVAENTEYLGASRGIVGIPHPPPMLGLEFGVDPLPYYYLLVALAVLVIIFVRRLEKSRVGRAWAAIREDEDAAEIMGVPTFRFRILAFMIGSAIGGVTGVLFAAKTIAILPTNFPFLLSAIVLVCVVFGGSGNLPGVILGAFLIAWLPERFRGFEDYRVLVFGAVLVVMMAFRPEGLLPSRRRKAELTEGTGGMGALGAEVGGPGGTVPPEEVKVSK